MQTIRVNYGFGMGQSPYAIIVIRSAPAESPPTPLLTDVMTLWRWSWSWRLRLETGCGPLRPARNEHIASRALNKPSTVSHGLSLGLGVNICVSCNREHFFQIISNFVWLHNSMFFYRPPTYNRDRYRYRRNLFICTCMCG